MDRRFYGYISTTHEPAGSDNRQRSNKIPVRKDVQSIHSNPEANKPACAADIQTCHLSCHFCFAHKSSHCSASPKTYAVGCSTTLTMTVQTVRTFTLPVQCKQRPRDRPIPRPGNRTKKRLRKKGGGKNCDELSGRRRRRRRRRRTTTSRGGGRGRINIRGGGGTNKCTRMYECNYILITDVFR